MSILYNKTASLKRHERSQKMVASRVVKATFPCAVQPVSDKDGIEWGMLLKTRKLYTDYQDIKVWDKIEIDSIDYIVNSLQVRDGLLRKYLKVFITESNWS